MMEALNQHLSMNPKLSEVSKNVALTLLWAESEANVMLPLLHKVNGRFSINHRTTNTGMASAAMANGNRSVIQRPTRRLCPHSNPDLQSIWEGVGPISAPHPSFLIPNFHLFVMKSNEPKDSLRNRLPWAHGLQFRSESAPTDWGTDWIFEVDGQHLLLDVLLRSFFPDWQTWRSRVIVQDRKGRENTFC